MHLSNLFERRSWPFLAMALGAMLCIIASLGKSEPEKIKLTVVDALQEDSSSLVYSFDAMKGKFDDRGWRDRLAHLLLDGKIKTDRITNDGEAGMMKIKSAGNVMEIRAYPRALSETGYVVIFCSGEVSGKLKLEVSSSRLGALLKK